jgi:hypothetical protein
VRTSDRRPAAGCSGGLPGRRIGLVRILIEVMRPRGSVTNVVVLLAASVRVAIVPFAFHVVDEVLLFASVVERSCLWES